jgi:hypothetical protein
MKRIIEKGLSGCKHPHRQVAIEEKEARRAVVVIRRVVGTRSAQSYNCLLTNWPDWFIINTC